MDHRLGPTALKPDFIAGRRLLEATRRARRVKMKHLSFRGASSAAATLFALVSSPMTGAALAQDNFYSGKQIAMIVSSAPGGGYDAISRTVARHLRKHIPGEPVIVVQNMGGTGGIVAANHVYNIASRDGLTITQIQNTVPFEPLFGNKQARYEPTKFHYLGSPSKETAMLIVWHETAFQSLADIQKREVILAATGASSTPAFYTRLLVDLFDIRVKLISGYKGQNEQFLAMERGENEGGASTFLSSLKSIRPQWLAEKKVRALIQYGPERNAELPDVPFALDLLKGRSDDRTLLEVASAPLALGRPFATPPGVPQAQLSALRKGLIATFADAAFKAECAKQGLECDQVSTGEELQRIVEEAYSAPKEVIERLRKIHASRL